MAIHADHGHCVFLPPPYSSLVSLFGIHLGARVLKSLPNKISQAVARNPLRPRGRKSLTHSDSCHYISLPHLIFWLSHRRHPDTSSKPKTIHLRVASSNSNIEFVLELFNIKGDDQFLASPKPGFPCSKYLRISYTLTFEIYPFHIPSELPSFW
jgi:hypothetical protein